LDKNKTMTMIFLVSFDIKECYLKAPKWRYLKVPSKIDFALDTFESREIWRICWDCSGEAMVKLSARCHDIWGRYLPNKAEK
jgi:hypothetical protein